MEGIFYSVAVPIGNMSDITLRAIEILKSVDVIACEDTRTSSVLLNKYGIKTPLLDCHKFNEKERSRKITKLLEEGKSAALISDAGTPGICDPGSVVCEEVLNAGFKIVPVPGANALATFLSAVPRTSEFFAFAGFLPKTSSKRKEIFEKFSGTNLVFYDSPNRLKDTLNNIKEFCGKNKKITIARELTKIYEEFITDTVENVIEYYETRPLKGEIIAMIYSDEHKNFSDEKILKNVEKLKKAGFGTKDITKILTSLFDLPKNKVYEICLDN